MGRSSRGGVKAETEYFEFIEFVVLVESVEFVGLQGGDLTPFPFPPWEGAGG